MLAEGRVKMYQGTGDESYLNRPHKKMVRLNDWDTEWIDDYSVPELAFKLAGERGLIK